VGKAFWGTTTRSACASVLVSSRVWPLAPDSASKFGTPCQKKCNPVIVTCQFITRITGFYILTVSLVIALANTCILFSGPANGSQRRAS
jgi:hypothetical protein